MPCCTMFSAAECHMLLFVEEYSSATYERRKSKDRNRRHSSSNKQGAALSASIDTRGH